MGGFRQDKTRGSYMQSVHSQSTIGIKDEQNDGAWMDEGDAVCLVAVAWVGWGDTTVAAFLPVASAVYRVVAGVVPGVVVEGEVPEAYHPNQRRGSRQLPIQMR